MAVVDEFVLEDQFQRPHRVRFADAPLTLLVFTGRATVADGMAWARLAADAFLTRGVAVRVVAVAAVGRVPGFAHGVVRVALAGQPPVPLDWDDAVAGRFDYREGVVRAVLVDAAARVRAAADGPPTEAALAEFAAAALRATAPAEPPRAEPRAEPGEGRRVGPRIAPRRRGGG